MGKKNLSEDMKRRILELREAGKSYGQIATDLQIAKSTVALWVQRSRTTSPGVIPKTFKSTGRKKVTSPHADCVLRRTVIEFPSISAREIRNENKDMLGKVLDFVALY